MKVKSRYICYNKTMLYIIEILHLSVREFAGQCPAK